MKKLFLKLQEARSSLNKKDLVRQALAAQGTISMPRFDPEEFPPIPKLEGPFQFRSGRVLYYDPKEGRYYDRKSDMYLPRDYDPRTNRTTGTAR